MTLPRQPKTLAWVFVVAVFLIGLAAVGAYFWTSAHGTTPESELTLAEGLPQDVRMAGNARLGYTLQFTVGGYRTEYGDNAPQFKEVVAAVESGRPVRIWVSTRRETLIPRQGWVPLYQLVVDDQRVLSYDDAVGHTQDMGRSMLIVGGVVAAIGLMGIGLNVRNHRRFSAARLAADPVVPPTPAAAESDRARRLNIATVLLSLALYGVAVGIHFAADVHKVDVKVFGPAPLGLPAGVVGAILSTVLYLPVPFVLWHVMRIMFQAMTEGGGAGIVSLIVIGARHPHLHRSLLISLGGLLYFILLVAAWIAYAAHRGL
jgi:hypothetical protein